MTLAVFSDVHADLPALERVLDAAERLGAETLCCLGDVVGYGMEPRECLRLVREHCDVVVQGNHDQAVVRGDGSGYLPADGRSAAIRHHELLAPEELEWLANLPKRIDRHGCTFVHATPDEPAAWRRLSGFYAVQEQFDHFDAPVCFIGHTHVPGVASDRLGLTEVRRGQRYLINVGSVALPRDGDPRPCLGLFDTEAFTYQLHRLEIERPRPVPPERSLLQRLRRKP